MAKQKPTSEAIAIIGMACIYPGAGDLSSYWRNIVNGVDAIGDVPEERWPGKFYDPQSTEVDRFYCRRGGFIDAYADFDPVKYGVMPKAAASAEPDQLLSLRIGVEALNDAGYGARDFPREKTGVIIGRGNYLSAGTLRLEQHVRLVEQTLQTVKDLLPEIAPEQLQQLREQIKRKLDYYGPDVAIGMIPNLVASRLANRLDLHGPAYTVDAACASSLLAIEQACESLRSRQSDMMLAGGLHFTHDLTFWATFCQLGALSRSQMIRPFSSNADGILAGEGIGILVLKRVSDAERDGDRIYALIHGVGSSSDGRSSSLMAPAVEGQLLALQRAWRQTGLDPEQIGLVEAHGTGTPAGDQAELQTLKEFFGAWRQPVARPVIGSVKSMIGHTMPAAGVAGVIKAALAVYHGILPPTLHCESPHELLGKTRFRVLQKHEPWQDASGKRIAAVNAFGFGGINAHVVLGAHRAEPAPFFGNTAALPKVVTIAAQSQAELLDRLRQQHWDREPGAGQWRLAIIEPTAKRLELAAKVVGKGVAWHGRNQIFFSRDGMIAAGGKLAFIFPGVDSSFEPQAEDVAAYFKLPLPEFCTKIDPSESLYKVVLGLGRLNRFLFDILGRLRIKPDGMAGHSLGEFWAMFASGMLAQERADAIMDALEQDPASMSLPDAIFLVASCSEEVATAAIAGLEDICISHDNCPHQVILCGKSGSVEIARQRLHDLQVLAQPLPFSSGFHSPMFAGHMQPYQDFYAITDLHEPLVPLWSATSGEIFPESMRDKKDLALAHLLQPVRFRKLIENMYADGYRAFIQVGTGSLPGFVDDILKNRSHLAFSANTPNRSGMMQLSHLVAALWVEGAETDLSLLAASDEAQPHTGKSTSSIRLRLGVPLVRLDQPLQLEPTFSTSASSQAGNDPLQQMFDQTLAAIRQASVDVQAVWRKRQEIHPHPMTTAASPVVISPAASDAVVSAFEKTIRRHLDVNSNIPYVLDHGLYPQREGWPVVADRHPVVPLTMEIMLLREAIEEQLPGYVVIRFEDVHAFNWLVVDKPTDIDIHLNLKTYPEIEVGIDGYMKARAIIDCHYPLPATHPQSFSNADFRNQRDAEIDAGKLYADRWMFHGPAYQGVERLGPMADNGICGRLKVPEGKGALLDNMGQLAGYWVMEEDVDCLAMPISVDKISFFGPDPAVRETFECQVLVRHLDATSCLADLQLIDDRDQAMIVMEGWQTRRYRMDKDFFVRTKQVESCLVCSELDDGVVLFDDRYDTAIVREYLARRYLNQPEMAEYEMVSPRRRRQWLNGRVAAKDAVRKYLWEKNGRGRFTLFPKELVISNDSQGQPLVAPHLTNRFSEQIYISIAHKDLFAIALAGERPVGIDIEKIESRTQAFLNLAFGDSELKILPGCDNHDLDDQWVARFWAAKEACAKQMGTGFEGNPKGFIVSEIDGQNLCVNGHWISTRVVGNYIIGWTV